MPTFESWWGNRPWWVKLGALFAGALMSAFSNSFPPWLQAIGLYSGVALGIFIAIALLWEGINNWRVQHGKSKLSFVIFGLIVVATIVGIYAWRTWLWNRDASADWPRYLSKVQAERLKEYCTKENLTLLRNANINLRIKSVLSAEAIQYAHQIEQLFNDLPKYAIVTATKDDPDNGKYGLLLRLEHPTEEAFIAAGILACFREAGLQIRVDPEAISTDEKLGPIYLLVGNKP